jgi:ABC-type branched-subunit amino acid transport system ATPase component
MTNASTDERVLAGIIQVAGGSAVFPNLSVRENLRVGAFTFLKETARVDARIEASLGLFPELVKLLDQPAGTLSGGEQQMVGVAKALIPEPTLLVIDELSLGLAPLVVQRLLEVVETLKASGTSMLVVEQSLTVAAAFADRALFLERGEIRYDGDPRALSEDTDLARAVFLGGDR